jgi:hypothetical protein
MLIISVLVKAREISSLNKSADWSEWNRKLKNYLSIIDLWKILNREIIRIIMWYWQARRLIRKARAVEEIIRPYIRHLSSQSDRAYHR